MKPSAKPQVANTARALCIPRGHCAFHGSASAGICLTGDRPRVEDQLRSAEQPGGGRGGAYPTDPYVVVLGRQCVGNLVVVHHAAQSI